MNINKNLRHWRKLKICHIKYLNIYIETFYNSHSSKMSLGNDISFLCRHTFSSVSIQITSIHVIPSLQCQFKFHPFSLLYYCQFKYYHSFEKLMKNQNDNFMNKNQTKEKVKSYINL